MSRILIVSGSVPIILAIALLAGNLHSGDPSRNESETANPLVRQSSRSRNDAKPVGIREQKFQKSKHPLRTWAAAMDDSELARTAELLTNQAYDDSANDAALRAKICAIFNEWGARDVNAALAFIDQSSSDLHLDYMSVASVSRNLIMAAVAGLSERDGKDAWTHLVRLQTSRTAGDFIIILPMAVPDSMEMTACLVFRNFLLQSKAEAIDSLRAAKRDGKANSIWASGVQSCLANTESAPERLALFNELSPVQELSMQVLMRQGVSIDRNSIDAILNNPNRNYSTLKSVSSALAGIAGQDPEQAWQLLEKAGGRSGFDNELTEAFLLRCIQNPNEKILRFISERIKDSDGAHPNMSLAIKVLPQQPEIGVVMLASIQRGPGAHYPPSNLAEMLILPEVATTTWPIADGFPSKPEPEEIRVRTIKAIIKADFDAKDREALLVKFR